MEKILIIEPKLIHWTTVEPLIVCYLKKGWKVEIFIPHQFLSIYNYYSKVHHLENYSHQIELIPYNTRNIFRLLFKSSPKISIVANRFFLEKPNKLPFFHQLFEFFQIFTRSILKILLLKIRLKNSFFIITTHFVDVTNIPKRSLTLNKTVDSLLGYMWKKSKEFSKGINVYSSLVKKNLDNIDNKSVFVAPNAIYRYDGGKINLNDHKKLVIVIPGRIDKRRRYYSWINKIDSQLSKNFDIRFIGKANSQDDIFIIRELEKLGFPQFVKKINEFISFSQFDKFLEQADILFVPIVDLKNPKRQIDRNLGAFFDSVRYGKPLIIPSSMPIPDELKDSLITYENDSDLIRLLKKIKSNPNYLHNIKEKAHVNSKNWLYENIKFFDHVEKKLI